MPKRIKCIDLFRGLTVSLMLIVENPGKGFVYPQLQHAAWNGLTLTDLIFAFFVFISGVAVLLSVSSRLDKGQTKLNILLHIIARSITIFSLGLFLNGFPNFDFSQIRITGVLQRIAIVYLITGILTLFSNIFIQVGAAAGFLIIYCLILKFSFVPGHGTGILAKSGNIVQYIDIKLLGKHMYTPEWDPEGILSTIPALSSGIIGSLIGTLLVSHKFNVLYKTAYIFISGLLCLTFGLLLSKYFPINKNLWSSSYVLVTCGIGILIILALYIIFDIVNYEGFFKPFIKLGRNTIFIYVSSELISKSLWLIKIYDPTFGSLYFKDWFCTVAILPWAGSLNTSLYFSIFYVVLWLVITSKFISSEPINV